MTDTFTTRVSGAFVLLSMAAEFGAIGIAVQHGTGPASMNAMNWGVGEQLVYFQPGWMTILFSLAVLAPCFSMLAWPGMYSVLAPGGPAAFYGIIVTSLGFLIGVIGEAIRFSVVATLPTRYLAASEVAKPAVLVLGAFLSQLFQILAMTSFILIYAVGMPLVALALLSAGTLPRWLGWLLLIPSGLVGYLGGPLLVSGHSIGGPLIGLGLNIHFVWFVILGVMLLRWRPAHAIGRAASTAS